MEKEDFLNELKNFKDTPEELMHASLTETLKAFEQMSDEEIMESIKKMTNLRIARLELKALSGENLELADRIKNAIRNIENEQIKNLREAIKNGEEEKVLSQLSYTEKSNLSIIIETRNNIVSGIDFDFSKASPEDRQLLEILKRSMNKDLLERARSEGFTSIWDWRMNH